MPDTAEGYALNVPDALKPYLGEAKDDPAIAAVRDHFKAKGYNQGQMDVLFESLGVLQEKGLMGAPFDAAVELGKLSEGGKDGKARRAEVETFAASLESRGDLSKEEAAELKSLAPTAAGVSLVEKLRKLMGGAGEIKAPSGDVGGAADANGDNPAQAAARAASRDPRYGKDRAYTVEADKAWRTAFS